MDSIISELLCPLGDLELAFSRASLSLIPLGEVGLGVPYLFAEKLSELGCMLCLLEGETPEGLANLRISLTIGLTRHGKIHADFGALALEVGAESFHDFLIFNYAVSDVVLASPLRLCAFLDFYEFLLRSTALRAALWWVLAFINIAANKTAKFLFHDLMSFKSCCIFCFIYSSSGLPFAKLSLFWPIVDKFRIVLNSKGKATIKFGICKHFLRILFSYHKSGSLSLPSR